MLLHDNVKRLRDNAFADLSNYLSRSGTLRNDGGIFFWLPFLTDLL